MRKLSAFLLAMAIIVTSLPVNAFASVTISDGQQSLNQVIENKGEKEETQQENKNIETLDNKCKVEDKEDNDEENLKLPVVNVTADDEIYYEINYNRESNPITAEVSFEVEDEHKIDKIIIDGTELSADKLADAISEGKIVIDNLSKNVNIVIKSSETDDDDDDDDEKDYVYDSKISIFIDDASIIKDGNIHPGGIIEEFSVEDESIATAEYGGINNTDKLYLRVKPVKEGTTTLYLKHIGDKPLRKYDIEVKPLDADFYIRKPLSLNVVKPDLNNQDSSNFSSVGKGKLNKWEPEMVYSNANKNGKVDINGISDDYYTAPEITGTFEINGKTYNYSDCEITWYKILDSRKNGDKKIHIDGYITKFPEQIAETYNLKFGSPVGVEPNDKQPLANINSILSDYNGKKYGEGTELLPILPTFNDISGYTFEGWYVRTGNGNNAIDTKMPDDFKMPASNVTLVPYFKKGTTTPVAEEVAVKFYGYVGESSPIDLTSMLAQNKVKIGDEYTYSYNANDVIAELKKLDEYKDKNITFTLAELVAIYSNHADDEIFVEKTTENDNLSAVIMQKEGKKIDHIEVRLSFDAEQGPVLGREIPVALWAWAGDENAPATYVPNVNDYPTKTNIGSTLSYNYNSDYILQQIKTIDEYKNANLTFREAQIYAVYEDETQEVLVNNRDVKGTISSVINDKVAKTVKSIELRFIYNNSKYYDITFKAVDENGNIITTADMPNNTSVKADTEIGKVLPSEEPSAEGYKFAGWFYNGSEVTSTSTTKVNSAMELVAKFNSYNNLIYKAVDENGNEINASNMPQNAFISVGTTIQVPTEKPNYNGYKFLGWYLDQNGKTEFSQSINMTKDGLTIYAKFGKTYQVTYNAVDEKGNVINDENFPEEVTHNTQKAISDLIKGRNPQIDGYQFSGWYYNDKLVTDETATVISETITLTAKFKANAEVTVKILALTPPNGVPTSLNESYTLLSGQKLSSKVSEENLVEKFKAYYSDNTAFEGYDYEHFVIRTGENNYIFNNADGSTITTKFEDVKINGNSTIIVEYSLNDAYYFNLSFAQEGLSSNDASSIKLPDSRPSVGYNEKIGVLPTYNVLGYEFLGWFNGEEKVEATFTMPKSATVLTAKFKANKEISVDVIAKLPENKEEKINGFTMLSGKKLSDIKTYADLKTIIDNFYSRKNGLEFRSLSIIDDKTVVFDSAASALMAFNSYEDVTIKENAKIVVDYKIINGYEFGITYYIPLKANNELKWQAVGLNPSVYVYGEGAVLPSQDIMSNEAYTFNGWYDNENYSGNAITQISKTESGNKAFYAKFTLNKYALNFVTQGIDEEHKSDINLPVNGEVNVFEKVSLPTYQIDGYNFLGWFNGEEKVETTFTMPSKSTTLTAKFEKISYAVSFKTNLPNGYEATNMPNNIKMAYNTVILSQLPTVGSQEEPKFENCKFMGWYWEDETGNLVKISEAAKMPSSNINVVAVFDLFKYIRTTHIYNSRTGTQLENQKIQGSNISLEFVMPQSQSDYNNVHYALTSTIIKVGGVEVDEAPKIITDEIEVLFVYDEDMVGEKDDGTKGDGIADKYQVVFTYESANNYQGTVSGTLREVLNKQKFDGTFDESVKVKPSANIIISPLNRYKFDFISSSNSNTIFAGITQLRNAEFDKDTLFKVYWVQNITGPSTDKDDEDDDKQNKPSKPSNPDNNGEITDKPELPKEEIPTVVPENPVENQPVINTPVVPDNNSSSSSSTTIEDEKVPLSPGTTTDNSSSSSQGSDNSSSTTEIKDEDVPLAAKPKSGWALINLILTVVAALSSLAIILPYFKKKDQDEDENENKNKDDEENEENKKSKIRFLSLIPFIASLITFIFTENIFAPMALVDKWTILMACYVVLQLIIYLFSHKEKGEDENDNQQKAN